MGNRYLLAAGIGVIAGIGLIVINLLIAIIGFIGGLFIPFFSCALSCAGWMLVVVFLIGVGWYTANYTWATKKGDAISVSATAGLFTGAISQSVSLIIGLALTPLVGAIAAVVGYLLAGGQHPLITAMLLGAGAMLVVLAILVIQFIFWVCVSILFSALGGAMFVARNGK